MQCPFSQLGEVSEHIKEANRTTSLLTAGQTHRFCENRTEGFVSKLALLFWLKRWMRKPRLGVVLWLKKGNLSWSQRRPPWHGKLELGLEVECIHSKQRARKEVPRQREQYEQEKWEMDTTLVQTGAFLWEYNKILDHKTSLYLATIFQFHFGEVTATFWVSKWHKCVPWQCLLFSLLCDICFCIDKFTSMLGGGGAHR